jgi:hypothetical protein
MIAFDIETGPLPDEQLKAIFQPPPPPPHPGEFDAGAVKLGNLKDAAKIAEKIESAKAAHESAVASHAADVARATESAWSARFNTRARASHCHQPAEHAG